MSRVWDQDANGYVRGETVASLFLQKSPGAKRIYATVLHSRTNIDGYKISGMFYPSSESQYDLMVTTYTEAGVNPHDVNYFEGHGTGTKVGDPQEAKAILEAYCRDRQTELPVGLLKSNIGHGEGASGVASLAKLLIVYENRRIPANLNMRTLKSDIVPMCPPLVPVTENRDYQPGIAGVNSFGIGGVNCHALFRPNIDRPEPSAADDNQLICTDQMPRLVTLCGRTLESVNSIYDFIEQNPERVTRDFLALLGEIVNPSAAIYSAGFPYRGSMMIKRTAGAAGGGLHYSRQVTKLDNQTRRPVCFFFSGMGSQWTAMGKSLMEIDVFAQSVRRSADILKQFSIDLLYVLLSDDPKSLNEKIHHFVAITSMQVALVDVFTALGVRPDYVIGHSFGEIACGYADGCLTLEQAIITSYWRGKAIKDAQVEHGMMAAVGLTWEETRRRCPPRVYRACHNSEDSVTISGAYADVDQCVRQLSADGIFAREVQCANIPFHSPLLQPATDGMTRALKLVLTDPRPRSSKWISTSVAESEWLTSPSARLASADYFVNNLISPVLFHESLTKHIPADAIVLELAPHHLFQAIFKRSMPGANYLGLLKRSNNQQNLDMFLQSIGQLYQLGISVDTGALYPPVQWPVARDTQSISSLIRWDHSKSYLVKRYPDYHNQSTSADFVQRFSLGNPDYQFLKDHSFDGKCVFPASGYLLIVWRRLAAQYGRQWYQLPVQFDNVQFKRLTPLAEDSEVKLTVRLLQPTGEFVLLDGQHVAVTGRVSTVDDPESWTGSSRAIGDNDISIIDDIWKGHKLDANDYYTELNVRGFDYGPVFRQIQEIQYDSLSKSWSKVRLSTTGAIGANWISFVESMIQLFITHTTSRGVYVCQQMPSLKCNPIELFGMDDVDGGQGADAKLMTVLTNAKTKSVVTNGLELRRLTFANIPLRNVMHDVQMEKYQWVANDEDRAIEEVDRRRLTQYIDDCNVFVRKIAECLGNDMVVNVAESDADNNNDQLAKLLNRLNGTTDNTGAAADNNNSEVLLRTLNGLYRTVYDVNGNPVTDDLKQRRQLLKQYLSSTNQSVDSCLQVEEDLLDSAGHTNMRLMRSMLDIVNENNQRQISIAELNTGSGTGIMAADVLHSMGYFFHYPLVVDYTVATPDPKSLPDDVQSKGYRLVDWDVSSSSSGAGAKLGCPTLEAPVDLLIYRDSYTAIADTAAIESLVADMSRSAAVKDNGFLFALFRQQLSPADQLINQLTDVQINDQLLANRIQTFANSAANSGFQLIGRKSDSVANAGLLFRRCGRQVSPDGQAVVEVKFGKYDEWVEELKQRFRDYKDRPKNENVWLFANDSDLNGIIGLVNCLRQEPGGDRFRCIVTDGDSGSAAPVAKPIDFHSEPYKTILRSDLVMNIQSTGGKWGTYRLLNLESDYNKCRSSDAYLDVGKKGDLNSLQWFDKSSTSNGSLETTGANNNTVNVEVYYSGVDSADVALALGQTGSEFVDKSVGFEFVGRRSDTGSRVMGKSTGGKAIATSVAIDDGLLLPVPDKWSLEDAGSAFGAYFAVWYGLINRAGLAKGETVLINSGCDSVGLAAIQVAKSMSCRVLATVSTDAKRQFLRNQLSDECILDANDPNIGDTILAATDGRGVDVVLNPLSSDQQSGGGGHEVLAPYGRWIDLDNYDQSQVAAANRALLARNMVYHNITSLIPERSAGSSSGDTSLLHPLIQSYGKWLATGVSSGIVQPIVRTNYRCDSTGQQAAADKAFKSVASGQTIGKVLIKLRDEEPFDMVTTDIKPVELVANTRSWFAADKVYILVGGLGGLGLEVAYWMAERGARKLILVSRSGIKNDYQYVFVKRIEQETTSRCGGQPPVKVRISTSDPSSVAGAERLVSEALQWGPLGGIFHFATVLNDAFIGDQTAATFRKVCAPKVDALGHLDAVTRKHCPSVDYFVAFSSQSSGRGFVGQNNYGYANSVMEHICERRVRHGLSGLAIQYGPIGDVGLWAANDNIDLTSIGMVINTQRIPSCLEVMDRFLHCRHPIVSTIVRREGAEQSGSSGSGSGKSSIWQGIGIDMSSLPDDLTLGEVGMESILAVEMQQRIEREYDVSLTTDDIKQITVRQIRDYQNSDTQSVKTKMAEFKKSLKK
ncbi:fatty acid synthase-like isoform X2 [Oppia nitens]|nr:fatty acid synthase-like isoform X2 [Oppia nitens]XP_054154672.1 fatty acid synthase-like isoform X2 [Oppia nitens]